MTRSSRKPGDHTLDASPGCRPDERPPLDYGRVARATKAAIGGETAIAPVEGAEGSFRVRSFSGDDVYTVRIRPVYDCDCHDATYRGNVCKHICLILLRAKDPEAVRLASWVDFDPESEPNEG